MIRRSALACSCLLLFCLNARAAEVPFGTNIVSVEAGDQAFAVHAADVDGDGDTDLIAAYFSANPAVLAWFENDGGAAPVFTTNVLSTNVFGQSSANTVCTADIDTDGDLDVLAASQVGNDIFWFENDGAADPNFTTNFVSDGGADSVRKVIAVDLDRDGDLDVLSANWSADDVAWYENNGASDPSFTTNLIETNLNGPMGVAAVDVDADGDLDVLACASLDNTVAWYESDGAANPSFTTNIITDTATGSTYLTAADMDGDGDLDVLVSANGSRAVAWYENDGASEPSFTTNVISPSVFTPFRVFAADVDLDGDLDALSVTISGSMTEWYENDGAADPSFSTNDLTTAAASPRSVIAADIDGDGDMDVATASFSDDKIAWYENRTIHRSALFPHAHTLSSNILDGRSLSTGDLDRDGDVDIVGSSALDDTVTWFENNGGSPPSFTTNEVHAGSSTGSVFVCMADIDHDGDVDVLEADFLTDSVEWYENDGAPDPTFTTNNLAAGLDGAVAVCVADVDGDGDTDALTASLLDNKIAWHENDGAADPSFTPRVITVHAMGARSVAAADVDRDGDLDVLSASTFDDTIAWYESDGGSPPSFVTNILYASTNLDGARSVFAADVDRDGDTDVLAATRQQNRILWFENDGATDPSFATNVITSDVQQPWSVVADDLDRDGDMDVLSASASDNKVAWYENDGGVDPSFTTRIISPGVSGAFAVVSADINGDAYPDVLSVAGVGNQFTWYENEGGQFAFTTVDAADAAVLQGRSNDVLAVTMVHRGRAGDSDEEFVTMELLFEEVDGDPLTTGEANAIIDTLSVYLDDGSGAFDGGSDTLVLHLGALALVGGTQTVAFVDGDPNVQLAAETSNLFFAVIGLTANANAQTPHQFRVTHVTESSSTGEDRTEDIPLVLEFASNLASRVVLAVTATSDEDGDGMTDLWEFGSFDHPTNALALDDDDGDQVNNTDEYVADTDGGDNNSFFMIAAISNNSPATLHFSSSTGRIYTLQYNEGLQTGGWQNISGQVDIQGSGGDDSLADNTSTNARSYRIEVEIP